MPTLKKQPKEVIRKIQREERYKVYQSALWKKLRMAKLQQNPLCEICLQKGKIEPAIDVHHIDSFTQYQGLKLLEKAYNYSNLLSVCKQCHQQLHNSH